MNNTILQQAFSLHQKKEFERAKQIYQSILKQNPQNLQCLNMLAGLLMEMADYQQALNTVEKILKLNPNNAMIYSNQGMIFEKLERFELALTSYQKAIQLDTNLTSAYYGAGIILEKLKKHQLALDYFKEVLKREPNNEKVHYNIGIVLGTLEAFEESIQSYTTAIELNPQYAFAYGNRGAMYQRLDRHELALEDYENAIRLSPQNAEFYASQAMIRIHLHQQGLALADCQKAKQLDPQLPTAYFAEGMALEELDQLEQALICYEQAIRLDKTVGNFYNNKGVTLRRMNKESLAVESFRKAIELEPSNNNAHKNLGYALLAIEDFEKGWQETEYRWKTSLKKNYRQYPSSPLWLGSPDLTNKTILIWSEQGLGDFLQMCRLIPSIKKQGAKRIIVEVPAGLISLLKSILEIDQVIPFGQSHTIHFDYHCPIMSLPLALKLFSKQSLMGEVPYLFAKQEKIDFWEVKLGAKTKPRIGLVWNGGFRPNQPEVWAINARRNIDFRLIAQFHSFTQFDFYSLQKGEPAESEALTIKNQYWKTDNLHILTEYIQDWTDTAGLIYHLDLIVSVDTSVLHLAGAMGKPVWLLNRFDSCWRWSVDRENSYWYPNVRIFHQPKLGDWDSVINNVKEALNTFCN